MKIVAALWLAIGITASVRAQILASGEISGAPNGGGGYDYTITLHNSASSLSGIQTFWFSWVPGQDFLPSSPTAISAPAGWNAYVSGGPYYYPDGYSIEFLNFSAPLNPGSSLDFHFSSTDSPAVLASNSPIFTSYPILTSYVYSGIVGGNSLQFVVQPAAVPEPVSISLLAVGSLCCLGVVRKSRAAR